MSIVIEDYYFTYLGRDEPTLKNINLKVNRGEKVAIVGPIGAGKSTLLKSLNGLVPYEFPGRQEGKILINGMDITKMTISELSRYVGMVLENPATQTFALTVEEDIAFGPSNLGLSKDEILERVRFAIEVTRLKGLERRNPNELSGGQQQSLAIAGILAMQPDIILLDEPLSMLDPIGKYQVLEVFKNITQQQNTTFIITESGPDIEVIPNFVDRVIFMNNGEILLDGPTKEVLSNELVSSMGVRLPQVTELFYTLKDRFPELEIPITIDEAVELLKKEISIDFKSIRANSLLEKSSKEKAHYLNYVRNRENIAIFVKDLTYTYEAGVTALKGISLKISPGEFVGIIGQNGSGKTTLALNIVGLLQSNDPNSAILVDGLDVKTTPLKNLITHVNYVFQNPDNQLFSKTVIEEMEYGPRMIGLPEDEVKKRVNRMLNLFQIEEYREDFIIGLPRNIKVILAIASVFALEPRHIIIDEPTTGLDSESGKRIMEVLKYFNKQGHTIIIITHDMKLVAEYCSRVVVLHEGRVLLDGPTRWVFSRSDILKKAFVQPPQITQLASKVLYNEKIPAIVDVNELADLILENVGEGT